MEIVLLKLKRPSQAEELRIQESARQVNLEAGAKTRKHIQSYPKGARFTYSCQGSKGNRDISLNVGRG